MSLLSIQYQEKLVIYKVVVLPQPKIASLKADKPLILSVMASQEALEPSGDNIVFVSANNYCGGVREHARETITH